MLLRVLNIVIQVTILGSLVGIVVSLLSIGFVYGVKEISSFLESLMASAPLKFMIIASVTRH